MVRRSGYQRRTHILQTTTSGFHRIVWQPDTTKPKVTNHHAFVVGTQKDILRLQISVNHEMTMTILKSIDHLTNPRKKRGIWDFLPGSIDNVGIKISTCGILHHDANAECCLQNFIEPNYVRMIQRTQDLRFPTDTSEVSHILHLSLSNNFHGYFFACENVLGQFHFPIAALPEGFQDPIIAGGQCNHFAKVQLLVVRLGGHTIEESLRNPCCSNRRRALVGTAAHLLLLARSCQRSGDQPRLTVLWLCSSGA
mmetsp:Transcript_279/g.820  ORF Transcript_279/g.820 Transcript_279/m.820 type:complete len:253 (-) Transcript_279:295-1053(-)